MIINEGRGKKRKNRTYISVVNAFAFAVDTVPLTSDNLISTATAISRFEFRVYTMPRRLHDPRLLFAVIGVG